MLFTRFYTKMKNQTSNPYNIRELFFFAISAAVMFFQLGRGSLASLDEATYGVIAREMLRSNHWLLMTYEGKAWLEKPPLCIWMIALCFKAFGITEFSVRLFSAMCGWGTVIVTYLIGSKLFDRWVGFIGGMFLLTAKHFTQHARLGFMDAPLVFLMSLALFFFWLGRERKSFFLLFGLVLGLAFLTKGLPAILVIPITWIYCLWANELSILKKSDYWRGVLISLVIFGSWNACAILMNAHQYMTDFHQQVLVRIMGSHGHKAGFGFYLKVVANKYRPWVFLLAPALPFFIFKTIRMKNKGMILVTTWMIVVFGFWTIARTQLHWYILPLYPALSICIAYVFAKIIKERYFLPVALMFLLTIASHVKKNVFAADYSPGLKGISELVKSTVPPGETVYLYKINECPANVYYSDRPTTYLSSPEAFSEASKHRGFYCLLLKKEINDVTKAPTDLHVVTGTTQPGEILLLSNS